MSKLPEDETSQRKIEAMIHKVMGQILSDEADVGFNALLSILVRSVITCGTSEEQFINEMKRGYAHYKKILDEESAAT